MKMLKYSEDLAVYNDGSLELKEVLTVGWLNREHTFTVGEVDVQVIDKLKRVLTTDNTSPCQVSVNSIRGFVSCPLCDKQVAFHVNDGSMQNSSIDEMIDSGKSAEIRILGNSEVWIPNIQKDKNFFATYDLIYHYIKDHQYLPPEDFIESVLAFDIEAKFVAERAYANCVRKYMPNFMSLAEMLAEEYGAFP
jgi:transcription elongation factor Elf1